MSTLRKRAKSQSYGLKVAVICRRGVPCIFSDGTGNCVLKTPIKRAKFLHIDRRARLNGKIRDGLADIAAVPHHLFNRESLKK